MSRVFVVRAGKGGEDEDKALELEIAIIGYREIESLQGATDRKAIRRLVDHPREKLSNDTQAALDNFTTQLHTFANIMQLEDIVVLPFKFKHEPKRSRWRWPRIGLGRVVGGYEFAEIDGMQRHTRKVNWLRTDISRKDIDPDLREELNGRRTVYEITDNDAARRFEKILDEGLDPGLRMD